MSSMEVDGGGTSVSDNEGCSRENVSSSGKLKRSSSAPMIHQLPPQTPVSEPAVSYSTTFIKEQMVVEVVGLQPRVRRFSASFGPVSPLSPGSSRVTGRMRVCQLREEEGMDIVNREAALERSVQSTIQVSNCLSESWEDLTLAEDTTRAKSNSVSGGSCFSGIRRDLTDPLHLTILPSPPGSSPLAGGCAPSPTRVGRQCFSPSLQQTVRNASFCPSPSPTKKTSSSFTLRRSLSPIALRPSQLSGVKRKSDAEDAFATPCKKPTLGFPPDRCVATGALLLTHSLENTPSPIGAGSLGSVGTPESVCSSGSPCPTTLPYSPAASGGGSLTPDASPHLFKAMDECECHMKSVSHDTSDSGDAMVTEEGGQGQGGDKAYQDMDLGEVMSQPPLGL